MASAIAVAQGGPSETMHALETHRWDHVFFTGGTRVGREVAVAAARHLTPLTLELGGKSSVFVSEDIADDELQVAAKRVWHGRLLNAGQVCISPDYVLVQKTKVDAFVEGIKKANEEFFGEAGEGVVQVGNIVSVAHFERIRNLLARTKGRVVIGGKVLGEKRIAPTVVTDVREDDALMEE